MKIKLASFPWWWDEEVYNFQESDEFHLHADEDSHAQSYNFFFFAKKKNIPIRSVQRVCRLKVVVEYATMVKFANILSVSTL